MIDISRHRTLTSSRFLAVIGDAIAHNENIIKIHSDVASAVRSMSGFVDVSDYIGTDHEAHDNEIGRIFNIRIITNNPTQSRTRTYTRSTDWNRVWDTINTVPYPYSGRKRKKIDVNRKIGG